MTAGRPYSDLRWSRFKSMGDAKDMYDVVEKYVFPFMQAGRRTGPTART